MKSKPTQDLRTCAIPALPDIIGENMAVHIKIKTKKNIVSEGILFKKKESYHHAISWHYINT